MIFREKKVNKRDSLRAFTLVELFVVVVIISIIAAFAIPSFQKVARKNRERRAALHLRTIHGANEIYRAKSGGEYLPGAGLNLGQINAGLSINIIDTEMTYSYTRSALVAYTATAAWAGGGAFTLRVNQNALSGSNPCCLAGACLILPGC